MSTVQKLVYGSDEIRLSDDADLQALRASIDDALDGKESRWVEIESDRGTHWILVTDGLHIRIQTTVHQPAKVFGTARSVSGPSIDDIGPRF